MPLVTPREMVEFWERELAKFLAPTVTWPVLSGDRCEAVAGHHFSQFKK